MGWYALFSKNGPNNPLSIPTSSTTNGPPAGLTLIWGGGLVMMLGGTVSLSDRRLRVGAPAAKRKRAKTAEAAA